MPKPAHYMICSSVKRRYGADSASCIGRKAYRAAMNPSVCLLDWDGTLRKGYVIFDWTLYLAKKEMIDGVFVESMQSCFAQYEAACLSYEQMAERIVQIYAASQ